MSNLILPSPLISSNSDGAISKQSAPTISVILLNALKIVFPTLLKISSILPLAAFASTVVSKVCNRLLSIELMPKTGFLSICGVVTALT